MIRTFILAVQTAPANNAGMNLWDMVVMGGWLMIPIFILSIIIIYIACERFWLIRKTGLTDVLFMEKIQETLKTGNTRAALEECEKEASPLAHTIAKGIKISDEDPQEIRQAMEDTANYEVANLERGLPTLATCAGTAPMIGFLGTVVGMVQSFYDMSMAGSSIDIGLLSRGIYTAMITTVAGLIVGIIGLLAYNFLVARVDKIVFRMEHYSSELIEYLRPKNNSKL
ncbi:MAG: MotA/TolQ/ExbB proton channel family protein [Sanguibacteroides justesenii]|nr:MotA/TolQ/ExbB proton channel family protein [Sanguibacteroides justesenii]